MNFYRNEDGQGLVEYGLILGFIAVVSIILLISLGGRTKAQFSTVNNGLANVD